MERLNPTPGQIYRHFKGNLYQIVTIATHTETGEPLVIYQALYGDYRTYARPLAMFMEPVDHEKYPDSPAVYRFTLIDRTTLCDENKQTPTTPSLSECTPEEQIMLFLDAESCKEKLEVLGHLRKGMTRSMADILAASLDLVLPGQNIENDLSLIEDHLRTRAKFELRR